MNDCVRRIISFEGKSFKLIPNYRLMHLNGQHTLNVPRERVWEMLMDKDTLARVVPNMTSLEQIEENSFISTLRIKMGPVNGVFTGKLQLEELNEPKSFTLNVQQNSKIGNANASIKINLEAVDDAQTEISFAGDAKLTGMLAGMGQRVLGGVANTMSRQFFANLENEIAISTHEGV